MADSTLYSVNPAGYGKASGAGAPGVPGKDGKSAYLYVAYASSATGAGFSLTPTNSLKFRAEIHTDTPIASPTLADFSGATWVKYIGDDGTGGTGTGNGDMLKSIYDTDGNNVVDAAEKLQVAHKIGDASFDGTQDITLAQIGAQPALPTAGTEGQFLQKTANGVKWATVEATGSSGAAWGQITGSLQDQSDLNTALAGKISSPSGGSPGQYLQKTATGVQWAAVQGGGGSSTPDISSLKAVRTISSEDAFEALAQEVKDSLKEIAFLATPGTAEPLNWSAQDGYVRPGHAYLLLPFQWKYSYAVRWKHFVATARYWKCTLKGGSCKVDGVQKTLRPGEGTDQRTDTYGTSWDATKPAKTTILRLALDLNFLYISATKRIQLNTNGTLDSDGNLIVLGEYQEKIDDGVWASNGQAVTELAYDYDIEYYTSGHWQDSTTVTVDIRDYFLFDLTANATYYATPTSTKSAALEIAPGARYAWTLDADSTLNAAAVPEGHWAAAQIDIAPGAHNVTAGSNLVIVDTLTANAVNVCEARWRNGAARLKVVDVITGGGGGDTPQPTPTITAPSSQSVEGTQGKEMTASIATGVSASNGASVSFAVKQGSALPAGLALSTAGDVTGTPTEAGSTTTTVVLSAEGCDSVEMTVTLNIAESIQQGTITVTTNPTIQGVVGTAITSYNLASCVTVSNGETPAFALASGQVLPSGVTLATDGILQGHPTDAGVFDFGVSVTAAGCASATLRVVITVVEAGVITVSDQVVTGMKGEQVSHQLVASASNGEELEFLPYVGNDCPANLTCSSSGLITGIPAEAKTTKVQFYVRAIGCPYKLFYVDFKISEASDGFPVSFTVSSVSYQGQSITAPCGTYTRTGEAFPLTAGSVQYPVYSYTGTDSNIYYICVVANMFGEDGPAWMLTGTKPTASSVTSAFAANGYGGTTLKSGSYEPADTQWIGGDGNATVSWEMGNAGTPALTAKAFGHPTGRVAKQFSAVLQKYTYTGTFTVGGETFPYYTGNGSTPWYLFGGKGRNNTSSSTPWFYVVYLSSKNPTTISSWAGLEFTWGSDNNTRLIMAGGAVESTGSAPTYSEVSSELSTTLLNSDKWWYVDDSDYPSTERADTITWE